MRLRIPLWIQGMQKNQNGLRHRKRMTISYLSMLRITLTGRTWQKVIFSYFAIRYRPDRISKSLARKIKQAIPNRIKYFDSLVLEIYPVIRREAPSVDQLFYSEDKKMMSISWSSQLGAKYIIQTSSDFSVWKTVVSHLIADTSLTSVSANLDRKVNTQKFYRVGLE